MRKPADVDEYLARLPERERGALEKLRATIKATAPEATEMLGWEMAGFKDHGRWLVTYAAFKNHYSLFPMSTGAMDEHRAALAPYLSGRGTIRFAYDQALPAPLVKKIIKTRLKENAARRTK